MASPLRIEYHDAWYHVMNRGANHQCIFYKYEHRKIFLSLLEYISKFFSIEIHAYCLMENHYHLLIKTPFPNLSKAMKYLNGIYTQKFNILENRDGALFRGRYKAILIQDDSYLLQVSRYIHLNPVEANLCKSPQDYEWSSYKYYINNQKNSLVQTYQIIAQSVCTLSYIDFINDGVDKNTHNFYNQSLIPTILGGKAFKIKQLEKITNENIKSSIADVRRLKHLPEIIEILEIVASHYQIEPSMIIKNKKSIAFITALYLARNIGQHSYSKIANKFNTTSDSVRGMLRRYKDQMVNNVDIDKLIEFLRAAKSQT